jgi:methylated-DNA-[protein]-cysteine S-methyltransferase
MSAPRLTFTLATLPSPLGGMLVVTDSEQRLRALNWEDREDRMRASSCGSMAAKAVQARTRLRRPTPIRRALQRYFRGQAAGHRRDRRRRPAARRFQSNVWRGLRKIPAGTTLSYGRMAQRLKCPLAVRAVGLRERLEPDQRRGPVSSPLSARWFADRLRRRPRDASVGCWNTKVSAAASSGEV